mgnify:CR=1 FL=1
MPGIDLSGKVALVTGASRGIGSVVAIRLAQAGAKVGVNFHASSELATAVVDKINEAGGEAFLVGGDVSQEDKAEAVIKQLVEHFGSIDILVNNAGINIDQLLIRMKTEDFDSVMNINLRAAFLCTRFAMTHMIRQRSGRVINMSSVVGLSGNPGQANYSASKAGLIGLTQTVAKELAGWKVTVNAVAPGFIASDMTDALGPALLDVVKKRVPAKRLGLATEIAEAVAFLASPSAGYITAQTLVVDGGLIG